MPHLYIITGSNGAGKSTIGPDYLPAQMQNSPVFDGDKLFMEKQRALWKEGIKAHKEARKLAFAFVEDTFERLIEDALATKSNFAYEGHFTNEATWDIPRKFKANGYKIHLIFFGLSTTDLSELRVIARTKEGGHYVDPKTVAANFYGNLEKLNIHFAMIDSIQVIDTSEARHKLLCNFENGKANLFVDKTELPNWFEQNLKNLLA